MPIANGARTVLPSADTESVSCEPSFTTACNLPSGDFTVKVSAKSCGAKSDEHAIRSEMIFSFIINGLFSKSVS